MVLSLINNVLIPMSETCHTQSSPGFTSHAEWKVERFPRGSGSLRTEVGSGRASHCRADGRAQGLEGNSAACLRILRSGDAPAHGLQDLLFPDNQRGLAMPRPCHKCSPRNSLWGRVLVRRSLPVPMPQFFRHLHVHPQPSPSQGLHSQRLPLVWTWAHLPRAAASPSQPIISVSQPSHAASF